MADIAEAVAFLDHARLEHRSSQTWSLFSGGDDSLATAVVTSHALGFRGCLHIDTGIGIPETQQFVIDTCRQQGWRQPAQRDSAGRRVGPLCQQCELYFADM
jgi:3'-phosphoadenosine 5'-phosphosulfate sulfotransferase (PAPS reductase)/FAD synthetase